MRIALPVFLLLAACGTPRVAPAPVRAERPAPDPILDRAAELLEEGDVAAARDTLERGRWIAEDRARAALLLCGCLLAEGNEQAAIERLKEYVAKTTRARTEREIIAMRLLQLDAGDVTLEPHSPEEACYMGLYRWRRGQDATVRADLAWAEREAPAPERFLVQLALAP